MTTKCTLFRTQRWWRLARRLDDCYRGQPPVLGNSTTARTTSVGETARRLFAECAGHRSGPDLAMRLPAGWARFVDFAHPSTWQALERLASLPPIGRFAEASRGELNASAELIFALLDLAESVAVQDRISASSLAQAALALCARLAASGAVCHRVVDRQALYWLREAEEELLNDRLGRVATRLDLAQSLFEAGSGEPTWLARLGIVRGQFFFHQGWAEPCLVELEAALLFCDEAGDRGLRGCALYVRGVTLTTTGQPRLARRAFEESLLLLPGSDEAWLIEAVEEQLYRLNWRAFLAPPAG